MKMPVNEDPMSATTGRSYSPVGSRAQCRGGGAARDLRNVGDRLHEVRRG
jgi:hypothetical protein